MAGRYTGKVSTRRTRTYDAIADVAVFEAIEADLDAKANIESPTFTGRPTAPTAILGTDTDQIATTAFVIANAASPAWGGISGTLADQADLQTALDAKAAAGHSHSYTALDDLPALGTAAAASIDDFATASQGALADTALQPGDAIQTTYISATQPIAPGPWAWWVLNPEGLVTDFVIGIEVP